MNKKLLIALVCVVIVAAGYFLFGQKPAGDKSADSSSEYRDTIIFATNTDILTLAPQIQNDTTTEQVVRTLYNNLLKFDDEGNIVGDLAEEWGPSEDGLTWTVKLKQGVKFHNGKEMTAADVKATFERAMHAKAGGLRTTEIIKMFRSVDAPDKYTVTITTDKPYGPMEALLCNLSLAVMDAEFIDKYGLDLGSKTDAENGTGPYKIASWTKDDEVVIERFGDYFDGPAFT